MAALLLTVKRSVMMGYGRGLFTHLIIVCRLNLAQNQNLLGGVKIALNLQQDFMIVRRFRVMRLVYYVVNVRKV